MIFSIISRLPILGTVSWKNSTRMASCFAGKLDIHRGMTVSSDDEPCHDMTEFKSKVLETLKKWQDDKIRGAWFKVGVDHVGWIPILSEQGFTIHNARGNVITLCKWLPTDEVNRIPNPYNMLGAGAVVLNSKNQVLVVQEHYRDIAYWKLPGGWLDHGEDIAVLEETNIRTKFDSIISMRHSIHAAFGSSDFYCVVKLIPLNEDIIKQDDEVDDCKWMDIDEYLNHPQVHENNRMFVRKCLENQKDRVRMRRETTYHPVTKKPQSLYSIEKIST